MKPRSICLSFFMVLVAMSLFACSPKLPTIEKTDPSRTEPIEGSELKRVILTAKAAERIGLETVPMDGLVLPYSAVIYDTQGNTWIYTSPEPLTFVRAAVVIDRIEGDQVFLARGLDSDAPVVTVGVAELYGAETGVSK